MAKDKQKSVLTEEIREVKTLEYTNEQSEYLGSLKKRLTDAKSIKEGSHEEFNGLSYKQYHEANEAGANTSIKVTKNKGEKNFQSGTLRQKIFALLSAINNLNLSPDIMAYDETDIEISELGGALEDIMEKVNVLDGDEEKRMLRQYELLKQGTVFVEDAWMDKWIKEKKFTKKFDGIDATWTEKDIKESSRPERNIISGLSVFLGDIRQYDITMQPYIFTVEYITKEDAEATYGKWKMWENVPTSLVNFSEDVTDFNWRLEAEEYNDKVEVIKYQDLPNNEFQIIVNGVPMLPMGYPMPWEYRGYSIAQQNLEPIKENFAYGKSFIFRSKDIVSLLDEMMKLAILKTQKSFLPPYFNVSGRVISRDVLMPGNLSMNVKPGDIQPATLDESKGVTNAEFGMINQLTEFVNANTVSPTFQGQKEEGTITATQTLALQRQSQTMMGLVILSMSLLEQKLAVKRLMILLERWFDPIDATFDETRNKLKNKYRVVSSRKQIRKNGEGIQMIVPSDDDISREMIEENENSMRLSTGKPTKIIVINPEMLKQAKLTWNIVVNAKERNSSELSKLMFKDMLISGMNMGFQFNMDYVQNRYAEMYNEDSSKLFQKQQLQMPEEEQGGVPNSEGMPKITANVPTGQNDKINPNI